MLSGAHFILGISYVCVLIVWACAMAVFYHYHESRIHMAAVAQLRSVYSKSTSLMEMVKGNRFSSFSAANMSDRATNESLQSDISTESSTENPMNELPKGTKSQALR